MSTVDKAQGREYDFVLLDLVTPGGMFYSLSFSTDVRRMCVALSRAKIGLVIFGDQDMADCKYPNTSALIWKDLIQNHDKHRALVQNVPETAPLLQSLDIPGNVWELVAPHALH